MITSSSMENTDSVALSNTSLIHVELRIAKIRNRIVKFACLDVGLIALLWIIYVVISGPADIKLAFWKQIFLPPYEFWRQSLFDIVILSFWRFIMFLLIYGCFLVCHWWPVAISVLLTSAILVAKVIYFHFSGAQVPMQITIIVISFVLSWIELWLVDFKLPRNFSLIPHFNKPTEDRRSLVVPNDMLGNISEDDFRSAVENSSSDSDNEGVRSSFTRGIRRFLPRQLLSPPVDNQFELPSDEQIKHAGREAMRLAKLLYAFSETWSQQVADPPIFSGSDSVYGKVFLIKIENLPITCDRLLEEIYTKMEESVSWNAAITELRVLKRVDLYTDVTYSVSAPAAGGSVQSREFVDVRFLDKTSVGQYCIAGMSIPAKQIGSNPTKRTRGENGPNLCIVKPTYGDETKSDFYWLFNTNLKGRLPRMLVERSLTAFLAKYAEALKQRVEHIREQG